MTKQFTPYEIYRVKTNEDTFLLVARNREHAINSFEELRPNQSIVSVSLEPQWGAI